jgi:hypothetical protein
MSWMGAGEDERERGEEAQVLLSCHRSAGRRAKNGGGGGRRSYRTCRRRLESAQRCRARHVAGVTSWVSFTWLCARAGGQSARRRRASGVGRLGRALSRRQEQRSAAARTVLHVDLVDVAVALKEAHDVALLRLIFKVADEDLSFVFYSVVEGEGGRPSVGVVSLAREQLPAPFAVGVDVERGAAARRRRAVAGCPLLRPPPPARARTANAPASPIPTWRPRPSWFRAPRQ